MEHLGEARKAAGTAKRELWVNTVRSEMMTNFPQRKSRQPIDDVLSINVQASVAHL